MANIHLRYIIIALILAALSGVAGFLAGKNNMSSGNSPLPSIYTSEKDNPLLQNISANIPGKVTEVKENTLVISDQNNNSGEFQIDPSMVIFKRLNNNVSTPSSDLKSIELNKDVLITLRKIEGIFKITSVSYLNTVPPPPPAN